MHEDSQGVPQPSNFVINSTLAQQLIETGLTPFINSTQDISMGGWGEGAHVPLLVHAFLNVGVFVCCTPQHHNRADARTESGSDGCECA